MIDGILHGVGVPIGYDDVLRFVMDRLADTAEATSILMLGSGLLSLP